MNNKPAYWVFAGSLVGIIAGAVLDNIPAGACLGTAVGILSMLLAFTSVESKKRT
jgi:hypothetical protein